jgi:uncharacterized protein with ParB-like and HNH nuclease domain
LGALIIEGVRPSSPREVKRFLVIDGQQRLTTVQLLLCAFRDIARKSDWRTLDRATTRYLENSDTDVMESPEEELFKLWPERVNDFATPCFMNLRCRVVLFQSDSFAWAVG